MVKSKVDKMRSQDVYTHTHTPAVSSLGGAELMPIDPNLHLFLDHIFSGL